MRNLITDVAGLKVGNAHDELARTGVTVVLCDAPAVASVHVMGGAPGTRETDLLAPEQTVQRVDALVLSGGSAFGLDAAGAVASALAAIGRGLQVGDVRVPIVPGAILFDLINGGDKNWGTNPPYPDLGRRALAAAAETFDLGTAGAGFGATTVNLKGGLGSASTRLRSGATVAALVAVNAVGQATVGDAAHFWAAPFEVGDEFGGRGWPARFPDETAAIRYKGATELTSTTIGVVATDATLTKVDAKRMAIMAHDGFARALWPSHTPFDGDLVFAVATGRHAESPNLIELGAAGAACMSRAIARGVYAATSLAGDLVPSWRGKFG
jgi:L-aminopeptidase/D-esterase-like protein